MKKHTLDLLGGKDELRISAPDLIEVLDALLEGARLAVRFAVEGESSRKGPRPSWLDAAAKYDVTGLEAGSVALKLEAPTLVEADPVKFDTSQRSLFEEVEKGLGEQTPIDIFGALLANVLEGDQDEVLADRALLDACARFARVAGDTFSGVRLGGLGGQRTELVIRPDDAPKIELLRDETPRPQAARISGKLDVVSATRPDIVLLLKDGARVPGRLEMHDPAALKILFGQDVVVSGTAHYRPSGRLLLLTIDSLERARPEDRIFEIAPSPMRQKVPLHQKEPDGRPGVASFFGTWPGDETDAELLEALRDIR